MPAIGAFVAVGAVAAFVTGLAPAAVKHPAAKSTPKTTVITVTAGKPSELAFKLSKTSKVPAGTITFKVTNMGVAYHDFRICTKPVLSASAVTNSCAGKTTPVLHNGKSATLTVTISKTGLYEFLCTVTGHAAAGMKGLLGVGVAVSSSEQKAASKAGTSTGSNSGGSTSTSTTTSTTSTPTTTTTATTTTRAGGGTTTTTAGGGDPECPPGVTIKGSGNADADGDELGTEPSDNDGCV